MASPASAAFLTYWRGYDASRVVLIKVELTDPTTRTLFLATTETRTPDGQLWQGIVTDVDTVEAPGSHLSTGLDACLCGFKIPPTPLGYQSGGSDALDTLVTHRWVGASVSFYLWCAGLPAFSDALPVLLRGVVEDFEVSSLGMHVLCVQRRRSNQSIVPRYATRSEFPRLPDHAVGQPLPIILGDGRSRALRGAWNGDNHSDNQQRYAMRGGLIPSSQCVQVDNGEGAAGHVRARVMVASHALVSIMDGPSFNKGNMAMKAGDQLALLDRASGDLFNTATGSGFDLDDSVSSCYVWIPYTDNSAQVNPAYNARHLLDTNEFAKTQFDFTANKLASRHNMGQMQSLGTITDLFFAVGYQTSSAANCGQYMQFTNSGTGVLTAKHAAGGFVSSLTPTTMMVQNTGGSALTAAQKNTWDFSACFLEFIFDPVGGPWTGLKYDVFFAGTLIKYIPRTNVLRIRKTFTYKVTRKSIFPFSLWKKPASAYFTYETDPAVLDLEGEFFAQPQGWADAAGTYTGTVGALIERAPDLAAFLLVQYGGQAIGTVEQGVGVHGSMVDARAKLKTWRNTDMVYFRAITAARDVHSSVAELAEQSASWFLLNRFTDKHCWVPWSKAPAADYSATLLPDDMVTPGHLNVGTTGGVSTATTVRVPHLYDAHKRQMASSAFVGAGGSGAGYDYLDLRSEYMTVITGVNDKMDFIDLTAVARSVTLTAGDYTPMAMAQELATRMGAFQTFTVTWGFTIVAGYNDKIDWSDGATRVATVPPGTYTGEGLAAAVAAAMSAVAGTETCTFSRTTRKFTLTQSAGTGTFTLKCATGANAGTSTYSVLGFYLAADKTGATSYGSDVEREEERYLIAAPGTIKLTWDTGTNGVQGTKTNCAELFGFLGLHDQLGLTGYQGECPKNNRETAARLSQVRYGGKREMVSGGEWIRDSATARELSTRIFDLMVDVRLQVSFSSTRVPDMERGKVITFSSLFDAFLPYPKVGSDGSWAGKNFYVVDVRQNMGPDRWDTEVTAVEAI